jgi:heptosyltransferase-2
MTPFTPRHILVSRTDKIGDLILSLPVFQTLRKAFPHARITALVSAYAKEVVQGHPAVDAVEVIDPRDGMGPLIQRLKSLDADVFIALYPRPKLAIAAWLAKIPIRIGTAFRWYSFAFKPKARLRRRYGDRHEVEYNLQLLRFLGITEFAEKMEWPVTAEHQEKAAQLLQSRGIAPGEHYVAVHPGHKGSALNWSVYRYSEIIARLCHEKDLKVVVTGGLEETGLIAQLASLLKFYTLESKPVYLIGECTLKQLAAVYQGADCFLSGSTGTMHLAAAVGTPTVSLFCPIPETTPARWGPWGNEAVVLMPRNVKCPDCQTGRCKKHDPMDDIAEEDVFQAVMRFVHRAKGETKPRVKP